MTNLDSDQREEVRRDAGIQERACEWCRIPHQIWKDVRCIETADDLVFCSAICLEKYEDATGCEQEIVNELPFVWDRV